MTVTRESSKRFKIMFRFRERVLRGVKVIRKLYVPHSTSSHNPAFGDIGSELCTEERKRESTEDNTANGEEFDMIWKEQDPKNMKMMELPAIVENGNNSQERKEEEGEVEEESIEKNDKVVIDMDFEYSSSSDLLYSEDSDGDVNTRIMCVPIRTMKDEHQENENSEFEKQDERMKAGGTWHPSFGCSESSNTNNNGSEDEFPKRKRLWSLSGWRSKRHKRTTSCEKKTISLAEVSVVTPDEIDFSFSLDESSEPSSRVEDDGNSLEQGVEYQRKFVGPHLSTGTDNSHPYICKHSGTQSMLIKDYSWEANRGDGDDQIWHSEFVDSRVLLYKQG